MTTRTSSALLLAAVLAALAPVRPAGVGPALIQAQPGAPRAERQFRAGWTTSTVEIAPGSLVFLTEHYPSRAKGIDDVLALREETRGFDFVRVESATATRFAGLVRERAGDQYARAEMEVEAAAPYRILRLGLQVVPRPAEFPIPGLTEKELVAALGKKLDEDAANGMFSGTVLLARQGKVLFTGARGIADRERGTPVTLDTRFRMGSMNKMFTGTAVLQLAQAGKLALDAPIARYITDYPNKDVATKVTVHHLLTHTGGTGDIFGPEFDRRRLELRSLNDYVTLYGRRDLMFEPGAKWQYSNYGFLLAGVLVERVSGRSYYDYVRDHIFKPAGMTSTGSEPEDQAVPNRAIGYTRGPGGVVPNTDTLPYRGTSAGGGYTTVGDSAALRSGIDRSHAARRGAHEDAHDRQGGHRPWRR